MILLPSCRFPDLTFEDESVLVSCLNLRARRFMVALSGAHVAPGQELEGVRLEIHDWSVLSIKCYANGVWTSLEGLENELSDICEFEFSSEQSNEQLRLAGFFRQAEGWLEMTFYTPRLTVEYASWR